MRQTIFSAVSLVLLSNLMTAQAQEQADQKPASPNVEQDKAAAPKAQENKASAPKNDDKKKEVIQVTGSRIKRIDIEGPTQVQSVSKSEMESGGQTTLSEVVRDIPVSSAGSTREESNRGAPGFSGVNLRGLGEKYTLVLLDGRRLPNDPAFDAVDIGAIPTAMIERIEILKEGAGAIYGSDAVGGVVNIITKKSFDGTSVLYSRNMPSEKGGIEDRAEIVYGKTFDKGSVVVTGAARKRYSIWAKDRKFIGDGWSPTGNPGSFSIEKKKAGGAADEYESKVGVTPDPRCPENDGISRQFAGYCQYNFEAVRTLSPEISDLSLMAKTEYNLTDSLNLYVLVQNTQRSALDIIAAAPGKVVVKDPAALANIKNSLGAAGAAGADIDIAAGDRVTVLYRTTSLGKRETLTKDLTRFSSVGLSGDLTDSWTWNLDYSYGQVIRKEEGQNGFWLISSFEQALSSGAFNPFDPNDNGAGLESTRFVPTQKQQTQIRQLSALASGQAGTLPGGPIQIAVGAALMNEDYSSKADDEIIAEDVVGSSGANGGGKRQVPSAFVEASLPLVTDLEANLAARFDRYEKYGNAFNPRLALKYKMNDVLFRSSIGTGFRAPTLQEENVVASTSEPSYIDQVQCDAAKADLAAATDATRKELEEKYLFACTQQQWTYKQTPSDQVKPEKATIMNLGVVWAPSNTSNLSLDWWSLGIKDRIGVPDLAVITQLEAQGNTSYLDKGIVIQRNSEGNIEDITAPATNLSETSLSGLDLAGSFTLGNRSEATFEYGLDLSYQLYNKVAPFEGSPLFDSVGEAGTPQYRMNNTLGTSFLNNHKVSTVVRTTAGTKKENPDFGKIPSYTTFDLHYNYLAFFNGTMSVGAINVTSVKPPQDNSSNPRINYDLYSYAGRSYYLRLTQDF